jgi:lactate dehydrogenase-like 2-hydroxyacid dehydrogenase
MRHPKKMSVTAHTAWLSEQTRAALQIRAIEQVLACLKSETPYRLINRKLAK